MGGELPGGVGGGKALGGDGCGEAGLEKTGGLLSDKGEKEEDEGEGSKSQ